MARKQHFSLADLRGYSRLVVEATIGMTDLVETMHHNIARAPGILGKATDKPTGGITGFVYRNIRGITRLVGVSIDTVLAPFIPLLEEAESSNEREAVLAALNGVIGDYLAANHNPLAITPCLRREGRPLDLTPEGLAQAIPDPTSKILVLVHGLCMNDVQWHRNGHDHGTALAQELGFTPVYLHYNSGEHVSTNGHIFANLLASLVDAWPVPIEDLVIVAHSMGGLVTRSACYYAESTQQAWRSQLSRIVFLGTPHQGAPLERGGNWGHVLLGLSPYTVAFVRLAKIRSAGITDLRFGSVLDEDWVTRDRFQHSKQIRRVVPLPVDVTCYAMAASLAKNAGDMREQIIGDGLVPLRSALGQDARRRQAFAFPVTQQWIGYGLSHWDLLDRPEVYAQLRQWLT